MEELKHGSDIIIFPFQKDHTSSSVENQLEGIKNLKEKKEKGKKFEEKKGSNQDLATDQMYDYRQASVILLLLLIAANSF